LAKVIYSPEALEDFGRVIEFLLEAAPASAIDCVEGIRGAIDILAAHPLIGRKRDALRRELVISQKRAGYIALYRYDPVGDRVFIFRLRHQREAGFADTT
jgi:plasmid stabilization system protein ParE